MAKTAFIATGRRKKSVARVRLIPGTGNIVIKLMEGMGTFFKETMNDVFSQTVASRLGYLTVRGSLHRTLHSLSSECTGGAPILGLRKPVIKAHGSSNAEAIENAVGQAKAFAESGIIADIEAHIDDMKIAAE